MLNLFRARPRPNRAFAACLLTLTLVLAPCAGAEVVFTTDFNGALPAEITALRGNAPNPFNPSTRIYYELPEGGARVILSVVDLAGRQVRTLFEGAQAGGPQVALWDGTTDSGLAAPGGVYVYRLTGGGIDEARKMVLLK